MRERTGTIVGCFWLKKESRERIRGGKSEREMKKTKRRDRTSEQAMERAKDTEKNLKEERAHYNE